MKVSQVLRIIAFHAGQHSARAVSYLMSYEPYEALIAPARAKASLLRLILGLVITALLYMLLREAQLAGAFVRYGRGLV